MPLREWFRGTFGRNGCQNLNDLRSIGGKYTTRTGGITGKGNATFNIPGSCRRGAIGGMAMDRKAKGNVIVIKRKTVVAGGHHGGAWKVAYADFVTAMMAFFLLMWLLSVTDEETRLGLADYFSPTIPIHSTRGGGDGSALTLTVSATLAVSETRRRAESTTTSSSLRSASVPSMPGSMPVAMR